MKQIPHLTYGEQFALDEWLSEYPRNMSYDEVIDLIHDDDDRIIVWCWFENCPSRELIENIDNTRSHFEHTINAMKAEGVFA